MDEMAVTYGMSLEIWFMILPVCLPFPNALNPASNCRLDFPFDSEAEKEALIAVASRKTAAGDALHSLDANNLFPWLGPYKCGFLRQNASHSPIPPPDIHLQ